MATEQIEQQPDDALLNDDQADNINADAPEHDDAPGQSPPNGETEQSDVQTDPQTLDITIGDEPLPDTQPAPDWVKNLRRENREDKKRIKELESRLQQSSPDKTLELGPEPTLDGCDYDEVRFKQEFKAYQNRERQIEEQKTAKQREQQAQQDAWNAKLQSYSQARKNLKAPDYEEMEGIAQDILNQTQQGLVVQYAKDPALMMYVMGKNPTKARELANLSDPIEFTVQFKELEKQIKMNAQRNAPPPPESVVTGNARASGTVDSHLERLRSEAEKSGDYSKLMEYKRQQRRKNS